MTERRHNGIHLPKWVFQFVVPLVIVGAGMYTNIAVSDERIDAIEERVKNAEAAAAPNEFRLRQIEQQTQANAVRIEERTGAIQRDIARILDKLEDMDDE